MSQFEANPQLVPATRRWGRWWQGWRGPWSRRDRVLLGLCPLLLLGAAWGAERRVLGETVLVGVTLDAIPITGVSRAALEQWIDQREQRLRAARIQVQVAKQRFSVKGEELLAHLDRSVVDAVLGAGRSGSIGTQLRWRAARFTAADTFHTRLAFDASVWEELLSRWERASLEVPREASIRYASGSIRRFDPVAGQQIEREAALALLTTALAAALEGEHAPEAISLPLRQVQPETTVAAAQAAEARARRLLSGPISVHVELADGVLEALAPADSQAKDTRLSRSPLSLLPRQLGPALRSKPSTETRGEVELNLDPVDLDRALNAVRAQYEQKKADASFDVDARLRLTVRPSHIQTRILTADAERALWDAAASTERVAHFQVVTAEAPRITTEAALRLNIHEMVSQYTTFYPCCQPRVKNIHRIAELMDGAIVLPGETFSINEFIGPRTEANGFVPAPTIVFGEMDDTIGGGVSQFATTLFNAIYEGGYESIERQPHTYYFERYPIGNDATLSIPKPDLIFRNDTRSGLLIKTVATKTSIQVRLFGDHQGRHVTRSVTQPFDRIEPELELTADDTLEPDKDRVEERGAQGFTVEVTRTITLDSGEVTKQTRKVIYRPRTRRVFVHSCALPKDHKDYTGKPCPEPEPDAEQIDSER